MGGGKAPLGERERGALLGQEVEEVAVCPASREVFVEHDGAVGEFAVGAVFSPPRAGLAVAGDVGVGKPHALDGVDYRFHRIVAVGAGGKGD